MFWRQLARSGPRALKQRPGVFACGLGVPMRNFVASNAIFAGQQPTPPSVKDSKPYTNGASGSPKTNKRPTADELRNEEILKAIEEQVRNGSYEGRPTPLWVKLGFVVLSTMVFMGGYVVYQTWQGKPALFPLWFSKVVPLDKADGVETIDIEKLEQATKEVLLSKLSMNSEIRLLFGLPLQLGDYGEFKVSIEYQNYVMEGLQVDCTESWVHPKVSMKRREVVSLPDSKLNGVLPPIKRAAGVGAGAGVDETAGDIDASYDDPLENEYLNQRDYSILIEGRVNVLDNENTKVDPGTGAITFRGIIEFDHTKTIKLTNMIVSYTKDKVPKVKKLW